MPHTRIPQGMLVGMTVVLIYHPDTERSKEEGSILHPLYTALRFFVAILLRMTGKRKMILRMTGKKKMPSE